MMVTSEKARLSEMIRGMRSAIRSTIKENGTYIENISASVSLLDPQKILRRGYTITSVNGIIVKTMTLLEEDDIIDTRFADGSVKSKIIRKL
jgi:exodeoxyribonuclease VII large subunit